MKFLKVFMCFLSGIVLVILIFMLASIIKIELNTVRNGKPNRTISSANQIVSGHCPNVSDGNYRIAPKRNCGHLLTKESGENLFLQPKKQVHDFSAIVNEWNQLNQTQCNPKGKKIDEKLSNIADGYFQSYLIGDIRFQVSVEKKVCLNYFGKTFSAPSNSSEMTMEEVVKYVKREVRDHFDEKISSLSVGFSSDYGQNMTIDNTSDCPNEKIDDMVNSIIEDKFKRYENLGEELESIVNTKSISIAISPDDKVVIVKAQNEETPVRKVVEALRNEKYSGFEGIYFGNFEFNKEDYEYLNHLSVTSTKVEPFFAFESCIFNLVGFEMLDLNMLGREKNSWIFKDCEINTLVQEMIKKERSQLGRLTVFSNRRHKYNETEEALIQNQ